MRFDSHLARRLATCAILGATAFASACNKEQRATPKDTLQVMLDDVRRSVDGGDVIGTDVRVAELRGEYLRREALFLRGNYSKDLEVLRAAVDTANFRNYRNQARFVAAGNLTDSLVTIKDSGAASKLEAEIVTLYHEIGWIHMRTSSQSK